MSARITLGSTLGGLVLLIIIGVIVITGSKANEEAAIEAKKNAEAAKLQSERNNVDNKQINATLHQFIDMWTERVRIGNTNTNNTQDLIVRTQQNILGNLTSHRVVTNQTFDDIQHILNTTTSLTGPQYEKLADKRVESIVGNLSADHEIIFKALNISKSDETTDAENDTDNLGQLLKDFIQDQKVKQNKPQGSKP